MLLKSSIAESKNHKIFAIQLKKLHVFFTLLLFAYLACTSTSEENFAWQNEFEQLLLDCPIGTELSIAYIEGGAVRFEGLIKRSDQIDKIDNKAHLFEIGSINKIFAATLTLNAIKQGDIQLDEAVLKHSGVSFEKLLTHSSGLERSVFDYKESLQFDDIKSISFDESFIEKMDLILANSASTDSFSYSNIGYQILGAKLSQLYSKPYYALQDSIIFQAYKMKNSCAARKVCDKDIPLIIGRDYKGNPIPKHNSDYLFAAGSMLSTSEDLGIFLLQLMSNDPIFSLQQQGVKMHNKTEGTALGWLIRRETNSEMDNIYWHNGWTVGYSACLAFNPNKKTGVIILSNLSSINPLSTTIEDLAIEIAQYRALD